MYGPSLTPGNHYFQTQSATGHRQAIPIVPARAPRCKSLNLRPSPSSLLLLLFFSFFRLIFPRPVSSKDIHAFKNIPHWIGHTNARPYLSRYWSVTSIFYPPIWSS
ncbi:hypothetical protein AVEN_204708-1 [Araneus ventricosus]|uniref:Uncharacterized protein n=1 Tax=Araneus ventricosus TaxID=182803 RepID=A0A4Y2M578_ARAVE|nr:hypothetical protein AVEN_204708-1 [Araneus ventricosus]